MVLLKKKENCTGCHSCVHTCPLKCITMTEDKEGFLYPQIDIGKCVDCGKCRDACPVITPLETNEKTEAYAAVNTDESVRMQSSSGGVFTALAETVLKQNGVVFGAGFDESMSVRHLFIEKKDELGTLRGSKYVQSTIGSTYSEAKQFLEQGRIVLFSGTPCQIAGLQSYLQKDYENLICQDLICHGAPSPMVWKHYLRHRETCSGAKACNVSFRQKKKGWKQYSVAFNFENNTEYESVFTQDDFMCSFLSNLSLRPSCYSCHFKTLNRHADITLADFWGVQNVIPEFDDNKGTSLALVHSEKGRKLWEQIEQVIKCKAIVLEEGVRYNPAAFRSSAMPIKRKSFMSQVMHEDFSVLVKRCTKQNLLNKAFKVFKRIIKHVLRQ